MAIRLTRREFVKHGTLTAAALSLPFVCKRFAHAASEIDPAAIKKFGASLKGQLILPGDADYDTARKVWNSRIDKHPALIARCATTDDVRHCVEFTREKKVPMSVRSGGHSYAGHSSCDGGLIIDLSQMVSVKVDRNHKIAMVEPGIQAGRLDTVLSRDQLATPVGQCPQVAIGGLALGGGEGILGPRWGATCDNVLSAQLVTAEGEVLHASAESHPDLFWAMRGAGANFAIATAISLRLHAVGECLAATIGFPRGKSYDAIRHLRDYFYKSPDDFYLQISMSNESNASELNAFVFSTRADVAAARRMEPLTRFGNGGKLAIKRISYLEAQRVGGGGDHRVAVNATIRDGFLEAMTDEYVASIADELTPAGGFFGLFGQHGAITQRHHDFNAYPLRKVGFEAWIEAEWPSNTDGNPQIEWVERLWAQTKPLASGAYVNGLGDEGETWVRTAYGPNYHRLVALKNKYDPTNFFRMNQNIKPTV